MLGASFLPARLRTDHGNTENTKPGYLGRCITPLLQTVSRKAFTHPIHTIVFVALLASTSYIGILEGSLLDRTSLSGHASDGTNLAALAQSGRRLKLGECTGWRWNADNEDISAPQLVIYPICHVQQDGFDIYQNTQHLALFTLVFPHSSSNTSPRIAPRPEEVAIPSNTSAYSLPHTPNSLSSISQDTSLAFAVPYNEAPGFLAAIREVPNGALLNNESHDVEKYGPLLWVMEAAKSSEQSPRSLTSRATNAWTGFVDLIKVGRAQCIVVFHSC